MQRATLPSRLDEFFTHPDLPKDDVRFFVESLQASLHEADRKLHRSTLSFVAAWFVFYALATGMVTEGDVSSFRIGELKLIPIFGPLVLGGLAYHLLVCAAAQRTYFDALSNSAKHLLPKAYELDLELLLAGPSVIGTERTLGSEGGPWWAEWISARWIELLSFSAALVPLLALAHVSWLMVETHRFPVWTEITVIVLGLLLWAKGIHAVLLSTREDVEAEWNKQKAARQAKAGG